MKFRIDCFMLELKMYRRHLRERILICLAWAMPRSLAYWATIRLGAHATTGQYSNQSPCDLKFMDTLQRWDAK
jgi:hypothetical protein